ncbi:MAG: benzoyl-CoA reductase, bzd-type, subunit N [Candidatus Aminicenantes bacterium]|nr:benzoyl-CoA reductase, bzd-type, subunit N [Candidatus Aminicenantes bacterium]
MMDSFKEWYEGRHQYAREWKKRTGKKVLGYFCTYVPEEILIAADVLPVRILGSHEPQDVTEPHIFGMFCPFCRDCLAQGLQGRYEYLDGIMISQSCLHIRQAYTSWKLHVPVEFSYYLPMPHHLQSRRALPYLTGELEAFKKAVEEWTGTTITEEGLNRGIEVMNRSRRLTRALYELRRRPDPPVTGLESMRVVAASQMVDKREYNEALQETIDRLPERAGRDGSRVRLMMLGSENDDVAFVGMVESLGAIFVIDDHCTGSRYFWNEVLTDRKPMESIAARYVDRVPCPTKDWPERKRIEHIRQLAKDWNVQGAIVVQQKFCDPHEIDIPAIIKALKQDGVPAQVLEIDVTVPVGQFKTRIEAFLEILKQEDLF